MAERTFEDAMKRIEEIVHDLESGDLPLEKSLRVFEEGMKLVSLCSHTLEDAEKKVSLLAREQDGGFSQRPFEDDDMKDELP